MPSFSVYLKEKEHSVLVEADKATLSTSPALLTFTKGNEVIAEFIRSEIQGYSKA
jgi:hypothetical protein